MTAGAFRMTGGAFRMTGEAFRMTSEGGPAVRPIPDTRYPSSG
jgi:hypothetical protein